MVVRLDGRRVINLYTGILVIVGAMDRLATLDTTYNDNADRVLVL